VAALVASAGCGEQKKPGPTVKQLLEKADKETTAERKASFLLKAARKQFTGGDAKGAKETLDRAMGKLSDAADSAAAAPRLIEAAAVAVKMGDKKAARKALKLATTGAEGIDEATRKAKVLADAGALYGDKTNGLSDAKTAKEWLAKANEVAESVEERFRAEALAAVALGYSNSGLTEEAAGMVEKLEACARALEEPRAKAEALAAAASVQARAGNKDAAAGLLADASAAAKNVERSESKAYAIVAVAEAMVLNGSTKAALGLLKEAEKAADKVSDAELRQAALDKVRGLMKQLEKK
jgi:hypothetical protein